MMFAARIAGMLVLLMVAAACDGNERLDFLSDYAGAPYMGPVRVRIVPPGQGATTDTGQGSVQFIRLGDGKARLVVAGNIRQDGDAGFVADGNYDASGWNSKVGDVRLDIAKDGTISGGGVVHPHRYRFGGSLTPDQAQLKVDLELLESSKGGFQRGTHFVFDYELQRQDLAHAGNRERKKAGGSRGGDCKRVEYRLKNVPNPFGGPLNMVSVPECVE